MSYPLKGILILLLSSAFGGDLYAYYYFGYAGRDGYNGQNGRSGVSGSRSTVYATDRSERLNLDGSDGSDAYDGQRGQDASSCWHRRPSHNLYGASGGNGGRGGNGGSGGNGGNTTVYYQDLAKLQNVYITARGGRSGRAGYGERAGNGCRCQYYSWRVAYKCDKNRDGKKNETCYNRYHCTSGSRGRDGYTGSPGRSGSTGVVTIIKSSTALPSEMTSYSAQVKNIVGQDIELSRHLWSTHSGANSLLAPGSYVTDSYYRFDQTIKKSFMVDWSSRRSLSDFSLSVYASLDSARNISLSLQGDVVYKLAEHNDRDLYTIKIEEIYKKSELRNFTVASLSGLGTKTTLSIDDLAGYGDLGSLKVNLVLKKKKGLKKKDLFEGVVPADKMSITKSGLVIDVGEISYKPEKYFDEAGDKYYVEVVIRRTWERQTVKYQSGELKIYLK